MGAWGVSSFDNDAASDWLGDLYESEDARLLGEALHAVLPKGPSLLGRLVGKRESAYLDADAASVALVAAEAVAALRGRPHPSIPPELAEFAAAHANAVSAELAALALKAVQRIPANSELSELWQESGDYDAWTQELQGLEQRLGA